MLLQNLYSKQLIKTVPRWLPSNTHYLTIMGSFAYGVSQDNSDMDVYGVAIPNRYAVFPHESGYVEGFGKKPEQFNQWQEHHVYDESANSGKGVEYDFAIYGIVNYFNLCMKNNPNVIDSLFTSRECVIHSTEMWELVRENRKMFLHKGIAHSLKGYAYSQMADAKKCRVHLEEIRKFEEDNGLGNLYYEEAKGLFTHIKESIDYDRYMQLWENGIRRTKRFHSQKEFNQDNKSLYHVYRLADQAEYILVNHDLDLRERGRIEKMKAIRRGDISMEDVQADFTEQERRISNLYETSSLQYSPDEEAIKSLLLTCLEIHFGSVDKCFKGENRYELAIKEIDDVLRKYGV